MVTFYYMMSKQKEYLLLVDFINGTMKTHLYETATRRFVVQAYLNTIKEGGETEFLYQNKRIKAVQGTLLIFPAGYTHVHRGNPPIGQDKYILTSWGMLQQ